jgi:hypothetical protein
MGYSAPGLMARAVCFSDSRVSLCCLRLLLLASDDVFFGGSVLEPMVLRGNGRTPIYI